MAKLEKKMNESERTFWVEKRSPFEDPTFDMEANRRFSIVERLREG